MEPHFKANAITEMTYPVRVFQEFVVLELKFSGRFPGWLRELVRRFNLMQFAASKYTEGVLLLGESRVKQCDRGFDWEGWSPCEFEPGLAREAGHLTDRGHE
jgi:hypothetical protein